MDLSFDPDLDSTVDTGHYKIPESFKAEIKESGGLKYDDGKAPMDLLPYESLEEIAKVLGFGEKKYTAGNWAKGIEMRRLLSAAMRHLGQFNSGQDIDEESGLSHLAHAGCCILFAIYMNKFRPDLDNRWTKGD